MSASPASAPSNPSPGSTDSPRVALANRIAAVPRLVIALAVLACVLIGLLIGGVIGGVLLTFAVLDLVVLLTVSWPVLSRPERLLRIAILVFLVCLSLVRILPH